MRGYGWFGLALLLLSEYCLFKKIEPFFTWFYCFAWWSYILLADNLLLRLRGRSLLIGRRSEFWSMLPLSIFIWLLFEAYNFVICNWAYDGVPGLLWMRWAGYAAAFATVLPAIFITSDLVEFLLTRDKGPFCSESERLTEAPAGGPAPGFVWIGLFLCVAALLWPRYFFPAVWLGPIFLLDPCLEKIGIRSLSLEVACGNRRRIWSLMLGGLGCGLMWEFWNFWAASRWVYTVPFFAKWKVFEMPLLGFLGFPPFALECWILYHLLGAAVRRPRSVGVRVAFWTVIAFLSVIILRGIDKHSVTRFAEFIYGSVRLWWLG